MNLIGRLLGNRYEIIEKIGNGGMATVYKAKCHILNRFVAVKILRDEFTTDDEFIKRFNSEAQAAASLTHPNIVSIYDVGNEGNLYYIVMELIQGKTLKQIINEDKVLSWKWSVNIVIQIASALETAHRNNIVHRDIKPHNIIITEEGIAKVTDFGIAKAVSNSTITAFGTTIGSVHYFSPEHARGGFTDAKSDLYSLGVVMYEMLTGRVPFDADTPVSIALKHMQEQPVEPIILNPAIPVAVNKIIMKAIQKDVNLRYNSATEMLRDLTMALKNPDSNFVVLPNTQNDSPTQRIPIIAEKNINNKDSEMSRKKKGKIKTFLEEHKKLSIIFAIIGCILIFLIALFITYLVIDLSSPKQVQIPNLVGMTQEEAEETLKKLKINFQISEEAFDQDVPAGKIISQDPAYRENFRIKEKSTIKVIISKGEEIVTLTKLVGKTKEEAELELSRLNLVIEIVEEISNKVEEGYVIRQEPVENTELPSGSTVKVFVSKGTGIEKVVVPPLIGETEEKAKSILRGLKLKPVITYEEDSSKNNGIVLKQSVESGKDIDEGSEVIITVNKLPQIKSGKVNVNLKSLTGYVPTQDENGNLIAPKRVELMVKVGEDTVYKQNNSEDLENITINVQGIGTVTIKIYVDGVLKKQGQLNLNDSNSVFNAS